MSESYVSLVTREFKRLRLLAEGAMCQLSDEEFFAVPSPGDNSVAVIVKHVAGNLVSRWTDFLTRDGEKPGRDRDMEFRITATDNRETLLGLWGQGWAALFGALEPLRDPDMARVVTIRGEPLEVLQAVNRQLTHYAYHVGQIVYVAKHHRGAQWRTLSIAPGGSAAFNRNPARYVQTNDPASLPPPGEVAPRAGARAEAPAGGPRPKVGDSRARSATRLRCHLKAPRSNVYRTLLDARAIPLWKVPEGMSCEVHAFEPREGGAIRISLRYESIADGGKTTANTDTYSGRFVKLVPEEQVVEVVAFETTDPALQGEMTITLTLADAVGGTELTAVHEGVPPGVSAADNESGWRMSLAKLAKLVETEFP